MKNKKILILGATGQIGKELSLKFKNSKNLNIISHARNLVSSSFFKHNGIVHVIGNLFDDNIVLEISNADLIFDLAAPDHGTLQEIKQFYKKRFDFVFSKDEFVNNLSFLNRYYSKKIFRMFFKLRLEQDLVLKIYGLRFSPFLVKKVFPTSGCLYLKQFQQIF